MYYWIKTKTTEAGRIHWGAYVHVLPGFKKLWLNSGQDGFSWQKAVYLAQLYFKICKQECEPRQNARPLRFAVGIGSADGTEMVLLFLSPSLDNWHPLLCLVWVHCYELLSYFLCKEITVIAGCSVGLARGLASSSP